MKILKYCLMAMVIFLHGESEAFTISFSKVLKFGAGLASAFIVHEGTHMIVAEVEGRNLHWRLKDGWHPSFEYKGEGHNSIQMAGLFGNAISSEAIRTIPKEKRGAYWNGFLVGNIVEEMTYPIRGNFLRDKGDFECLSKRNRVVWGSIFFLHGAITAYQVYKDDHLNLRTWVGFSEVGTPMGGFKIIW